MSQFLPTSLELKLDNHVLCKPPVHYAVAGDGAAGSNGKRRMLAFNPAISSSPVGALSLARLIPGVETSALASWIMRNVDVSEEHKRFPEWDTVDTIASLPSLLITCRFDMANEYPFSTFGISGDLVLSAEAYPWYGGQMLGALMMPTPFQLKLTAAYEGSIEIASGIMLTDAFLSVVLKPVRQYAGASVAAVFSVGGRVEMTLGQKEPLSLSASVSIMQGSSVVSFQALLENWENALGIDGFTLAALQLFGTVNGREVDLDIQANWELRDGKSFALAGAKRGETLAVGVHIEEFSLQTLISIMQEIFGGQCSHSHILCAAGL